ncbi:MAG: acetaldehyde dehydrogenase (acetylating) [Treponemataceae bacterium]
MLQDKDLLSLQNVRDLVTLAQKAQKKYATCEQSQMDALVQAISVKLSEHAQELAKMAVEDTGFGRVEDKIIKNLFASITVYEHMKNQKLVGIIDEDPVKKVISVGVPVGVIAALIPSTNPTSTTIYKALISLKSGNAVIFSPHPSALRCILRTVELIQTVITKEGFSADLVSCLSIPTIQATSELMKKTQLILATGGPDMVRSAYSSGTPALGVGPGNVPAFIERTADISHAVKCIIDSKTFDNGTICASEQMIITEECIASQVEQEFKKHGGYFLNQEEQAKFEAIILGPTRKLNPKIVGKTALDLAKMAGVSVPANTQIIIGRTLGVGKDHPFSVEKLSPLLGYYVEKNWQDACSRSIEILEFEGIGHSLVIHTTNESIIKEFALKIPVSRLLINTPSALGGIGATTSIAPSLTLGCGAVGGSAISANVEAKHLINVRKASYGLLEKEELTFDTNFSPRSQSIADIDIEKITRIVIEQLNKK